MQVLRSDRRGDQAPVLAVVGPMQFEVAQHRMEHEFNAPIELERLPYSLALRTDEASAPKVADRPRRRGAAADQRRAARACSATSGACGCFKENNPELTLEPLVAAQL